MPTEECDTHVKVTICNDSAISLPQDVQTPLHVFILKNHPPVLLLMKNLLIVHMILLTQLQMKSFPDFAACTTAPMLPL